MNFSDISYTNLQNFVRIYQAGNITRAAHGVGISAPAFNESLHKLEKQLGVKLFITGPGRTDITPTAEAHTLYKHLLPAFAILDRAKKQITTFDETSEGEIHIGCPAHIMNGTILDYILEFREKFPLIKILVNRARKPEAIKLLESHKIDLIINRLPIENVEGKFQVDELMKYTKILFASNRFLDQRKLSTCLTKSQLKELPFVLPFKDRNDTKMLTDALGFELNTVVEMSGGTELMYNIVAKHLGIGYCT